MVEGSNLGKLDFQRGTEFTMYDVCVCGTEIEITSRVKELFRTERKATATDSSGTWKILPGRIRSLAQAGKGFFSTFPSRDTDSTERKSQFMPMVPQLFRQNATFLLRLSLIQ